MTAEATSRSRSTCRAGGSIWKARRARPDSPRRPPFRSRSAAPSTIPGSRSPRRRRENVPARPAAGTAPPEPGDDALPGDGSDRAAGGTTGADDRPAASAPPDDPVDPTPEPETAAAQLPLTAVPVKPDTPAESAEAAPDASGGPAPQAGAAAPGGGLLDLLGGSSKPDGDRGDEAPEPEPSGRELDMDRLLDELRRDLGD